MGIYQLSGSIPAKDNPPCRLVPRAQSHRLRNGFKGARSLRRFQSQGETFGQTSFMQSQIQIIRRLDSHYGQPFTIGFRQPLRPDIMPLPVIKPCSIVSRKIECRTLQAFHLQSALFRNFIAERNAVIVSPGNDIQLIGRVQIIGQTQPDFTISVCND